MIAALRKCGALLMARLHQAQLLAHRVLACCKGRPSRISGGNKRFQIDAHGLNDGRDSGYVRFKDFMVAGDRMAGTAVLVCAAVVSIWFISEAMPMRLVVPSATASGADGASHSVLVAAGALTALNLRMLQSKLEGLGFEPGLIDGIAGGRTLDALNRYRATKNLTRASQIDYATAADLLD